MEFFTNIWNWFVTSTPDIIVAILYLLVAFCAARLAKAIVMGILDKTGAEKLLAKTGIKDEKTGKSTEFVGKLVFLIVFLLFLPAVLNRLGMSNVAAPITSVVQDIIGFLPKLLAAGIVLYVGIYLAKVVKQLVESLLDRVGLNKLQKKMGIETEEQSNTFTGVLSGIVYVLILVPVIIAALQILDIDAISGPASVILSQVFGYLPLIFVAIIILVVGYQLAKLLAPVIENLLKGIGTDNLTKKLTDSTDAKIPQFSISKIIGQVVRWLIMIVFFIEAVNVLNLDILTNIGAAVLSYLPLAVSAIIIIGGGLILASWLETLILKHAPKHRVLAIIAKIAIIVLAVFMTLSQLGFAQSIVNTAFIIIMAALAVAFAVAFGIGGRTFAANRLQKLEAKLDEQEVKE